MPIEVGIWRVGSQLSRVETQALQYESTLENSLASDLSLIEPGLMLIGRQVPTSYGKYIDLLAIDQSGDLLIIELKRDKTPREVVAQTLDYASWVEALSYDEVAEIYSENHEGQTLEQGFVDNFGVSLSEKINQKHRLIVVAADLDSSSERIINYLNENYGVPINTVFFRYFKDDDREYLTRTWLIEPRIAEIKASKGKKSVQEAWNQKDFYVSQGEGPDMNWDDCRKYGFVCGGGGRWYSQTLEHLFVGARIFVNIPKRGYVGVGEVLEESCPVKNFKVKYNGKVLPILQLPLTGSQLGINAEDPELTNYAVRVKWVRAVSREEAYWIKGLFAIQHTACKMRSQFTIQKLCEHFKLDD
jgi:hypothetical protein